MGLVDAFIDRQYPAPRVNRGFGDLPPNIQGGTCWPWPANATLGPGNAVIINGQIVDYIGVDNQRLLSSGQPVCHGGDSYQDLTVPVVLSVPDDVRQILGALIINSTVLSVLETAAQANCVATQKIYGTTVGRQFLDAWTLAQTQQAQAQAAKANADDAWARFKTIDDSVEGAYSRGDYQDKTMGAVVMKALQGYNHVPIAFDNVNAAAQCVWDEFWDYAHDQLYQDFLNRFTAMQPQAEQVAQIFADVQDFLEKFSAAANQVTLSKDATEKVNDAIQSYKDLTDLARGVAAPWSVAQGYQVQAASGLENNIQNVFAIETADQWIRNVQINADFPSAVQNAQAMAANIHADLDSIWSQLQAAGVDGNTPPAAPKSHGKAIALGAVAVGGVALLIKKGILFG